VLNHHIVTFETEAAAARVLPAQPWLECAHGHYKGSPPVSHTYRTRAPLRAHPCSFLNLSTFPRLHTSKQARETTMALRSFLQYAVGMWLGLLALLLSLSMCWALAVVATAAVAVETVMALAWIVFGQVFFGKAFAFAAAALHNAPQLLLVDAVVQAVDVVVTRPVTPDGPPPSRVRRIYRKEHVMHYDLPVMHMHDNPLFAHTWHYNAAYAP